MNKRKFQWQRYLIPVAITFVAFKSFAYSVATVMDEPLTEIRNEQSFTVKTGTLHYFYEEPDFMKIEGPMYLLGFGYTRVLPTRTPLKVGGDIQYMFGRTQYDGGLTDGKTSIPKKDGSSDSILDLRGLFGIVVVHTPKTNLDLHTGLGIWSLHNKVDGRGSYTREVSYTYLPMGVEFNQLIGSSFIYSATAEYNLFVAGQVTSKLSEVDPRRLDTHNTQRSGGGYRLQTSGQLILSSVSLLAETYYQAWNIDDSDIVYAGMGKYGMEPHNTTSMLGINLGMKF